MNQGYVSVTGVVPYIRHSQPHNTLGWSKYGRPLMNHPQRRNSSHKNSLHNPNQAFPRVKSWGYPGCFGVSLFLTYPPPRHGRVRNGWKHSVKGSISYKVKKLRTPTFNQTLQEIWVCRAYAIHGHSRTENQKHLTALKAPVIYQEARKAGQEDSNLQIKTLKLEQTAIFFMAWLSIQAPKIAICHCLSPLNHASLNSDFIEGHFFATNQSPAAICVSEPHLQRGQRDIVVPF